MEKKMKDIARHEKDTGSSEVQIAHLTSKIENPEPAPCQVQIHVHCFEGGQ